MAARGKGTTAAPQRNAHRGMAAGSTTNTGNGAPGARSPEIRAAARGTADCSGEPTSGPEQAGFAGSARGIGPLRIGSRRYGPY